MCWDSINNSEIPKLSIAKGIDFGYHERVGLEPPNLDEQMILARCRLIIATMKLKSNQSGKVGFHCDKLNCHAILFSHDAPNRAASLINAKEMLEVKQLKDMLKLYFLDPDGNIDRLFQAAMERTNIFACSWVICQWLEILTCQHEHYGDIIVPDFNYIKACIKKANKAIQDEAVHVTSEAAFAVESQIGSDVAQTQTTEVQRNNIVNQQDENGERERHKSAMRVSYVLDNVQTHLEDAKLEAFRSLNAIANTVLEGDEERLSINQQDDDTCNNSNTTLQAYEEDRDDISTEPDWDNWTMPDDLKEDEGEDYFQKYGSRQLPDAINEFTEKEKVLTMSFPHIFIRGKAYGRCAGKMSQEQYRHLLHQFHMVPSRDWHLLAYLTDAKLRCNAIFGVHAYTQQNPTSLEEITRLMNNNEEKKQLHEAIQKPESDLAKHMLQKYKPHFTFCGKDINYGAMEGHKLKSMILETQKRMQSPFCFLTLNMEEIHNPRSIRACAKTIDNKHFPAMFEETCPYGKNGTDFMEHLRNVGETIAEGQIDFSEAARACMAMDDPITFVEETKQMLNDVCSILLGIPPEDFFAKLDSNSRRKTKYFKCNKGVFGHCLAYIGVTEDHKKGTLHFHILIFGGIPSYAMQRFASMPDICAEISKVLDTMFNSEIPSEQHLPALIHKLADEGNVPLALGIRSRETLLGRPTHKFAASRTGKITHDSIKLATYDQAGRQCHHKHLETCRKGYFG